MPGELLDVDILGPVRFEVLTARFSRSIMLTSSHGATLRARSRADPMIVARPDRVSGAAAADTDRRRRHAPTILTPAEDLHSHLEDPGVAPWCSAGSGR
jgi:hypothetical protein